MMHGRTRYRKQEKQKKYYRKPADHDVPLVARPGFKRNPLCGNLLPICGKAQVVIDEELIGEDSGGVI